jgi:hypothetical protein
MLPFGVSNQHLKTVIDGCFTFFCFQYIHWKDTFHHLMIVLNISLARIRIIISVDIYLDPNPVCTTSFLIRMILMYPPRYFLKALSLKKPIICSLHAGLIRGSENT